MERVLISDGLQEEAINKLKSLGMDVVNKHYDGNKIGQVLRDFDIVVIRSSTKITRSVIETASKGRLKLIIRAGVGVDNIDIDYAKIRGVEVKNTPNASSESVAELALAHMLSISRFIGISNYTMRNGEWNKKQYKGIELNGKTLGIIGLGRIGKSLAKKADALGMKVVYYTIEGKYEKLKYQFMEFNEVLKNSDFISVHVPYDKKKASLIGKEQFSLMKNGVYIVNCSRGKVVDEEELLWALKDGKVAGVGIDVFSDEPTKNLELINHPRVSCTPHIGASTLEAQSRIGDEVVSTIREFLNIN